MATFDPGKQFKTAVAVAASAAQSLDSTALPVASNSRTRQARVAAKTADTVICFGGPSVVANATYTGGALPDGNFVVPAGQTQSFDLGPADTHYSVISEDGAATGQCWVTQGIRIRE